MDGSVMLKGSYVALITPFNNDGSVDYESLKTLIKWHNEQGTSGFVVLGTTAESPTITDEERQEIIRVVMQERKLPVWVGVGTHCTRQTIEYAKQAQDFGVDGVMIVAPYYNKPTQAGIVAHIKAVHDAVDLPIMLYNVPGRTVVDMSLNTVELLSALPRVVAIKDATGDCHRLEDYSRIADLSVFSGDDGTTGPFLIQGGHGMVSVTANIAPNWCASMAKAAQAGDFDEVLFIHERLSDLNDFLFVESNPIAVKWLMAKLGMIQPHLRLPLTPLSDQYMDQGVALLDRESNGVNPLLHRFN